MKKADLKKRAKVKTRFKVGDEVIVISGKNKNSKGEILAMNTITGRVLVKGVNFKRRFSPPSQELPKGGIIEREAPMHISNVQLLDPKLKKPTRIAFVTNKSGKKVRIAVKSKVELD